MIALFEVLLCYKIEGDFEHLHVSVESTYGNNTYKIYKTKILGVVFLPIWVLMTTLGFQACRLL